VAYGLYLYFLGLSFRNASKALTSRIVKRSHVFIWKWVQKYKPQKISQKKSKISEFIIDETLLKLGNQLVWVWIAIIDESTKVILAIRISIERTILIAE
jgi:transposase-like protein